MPRIARFAFIYLHSSFDTSLLLIYIDFFVLARAQEMSCDGKPGWLVSPVDCPFFVPLPTHQHNATL